MELAEQVRKYYLDNLEKLPRDKQFHFASRLASWSNDRDCQNLLHDLKDHLYPTEHSPRELLQDIMTNLPINPINAAAERASYFEKYPYVRGEMLALFRVRHLLYLYDIDIREDLLAIIPESKLHEHVKQLLIDPDAMRTLSTYAINYLYLVEHILFPASLAAVNREDLYRLGQGYGSDRAALLLQIYFYTHCIIGETNFYMQSIDSEHIDICRRMLDYISGIISEHYDNINLDNKLEYLVCCRILSQETNLSARIYQECEQSVSPDGLFLIDTKNNAAQHDKSSFDASEHRNVLFIMSTSSYAAS